MDKIDRIEVILISSVTSRSSTLRLLGLSILFILFHLFNSVRYSIRYIYKRCYNMLESLMDGFINIFNFFNNNIGWIGLSIVIFLLIIPVIGLILDSIKDFKKKLVSDLRDK